MVDELKIGQKIWAVTGYKFYESLEWQFMRVVKGRIHDFFITKQLVYIMCENEKKIYKSDEIFPSLEDAYKFAIEKQKALIENITAALSFNMEWLQKLEDRDV